MKLRKLPPQELMELNGEERKRKIELQLLFTLRTESTWTGFDCDNIKLIANLSESNFYLVGIPCRRDRPHSCLPRPPKQRIKVSKHWVQKIFTKLETTQIPLFPEPQMGSDGGFMEFEIGGYTVKDLYRWWVVRLMAGSL